MCNEYHDQRNVKIFIAGNEYVVVLKSYGILSATLTLAWSYSNDRDRSFLVIKIWVSIQFSGSRIKPINTQGHPFKKAGLL